MVMMMIKTFQIPYFKKRFFEALEKIESVSFDDEWIVIHGIYINYKIITYDNATNYSYKNNCIYINPRNVDDSTLLNIFIKKAYRHRKKLPF
jgi:hypothetical protein